MDTSREWGILNNKPCFNYFSRLNDEYKNSISQTCKMCREKRKFFEVLDKKNKYSSFSCLLPGFSSASVELPIDVLIVAEAHGGGREKDFRRQGDLAYEISYIGGYYIHEKIVKFHQYQVRKLISELDTFRKTWIFTDLIKCFVANEKKNREIAISYCGNFLKEQLDLLQPKTIIVLGQTAGSYFGLKEFKHATLTSYHNSNLIYSIFPGMYNADRWVENGQWEPVLKKLQ